MKILSQVLAIATFLLLSLGIVLNTVYPEPLWGYITLSLAAAAAGAWATLNWKTLLRFFTQKSTRHGANLAFVVFLVLGILVFVNVLAKQYNWRKDVTRSSSNSLSPQTLKILGDLKQDVKVMYFNSINEKERTEPLFKNYEYNSKHFKYEFVDTVRRPTITQTMEVKRNDTVVLSLEGTNKRVKIDGSTEEKITNGLIKLLQSKEQAIYFLTGHNERSFDNAEDALSYTNVKLELEKQGYTVKQVSLVQEGKIPADAAALVIAGPKAAFYPKELELLAAWIKGGGHLLLAVDLDPAVSGLSKGSQQAAELVKPYGITIPGEMLVDPLSSAANVEPQVLLGFSGSKDHPVTRDFPHSAVAANFFMPLTASVNVNAVEGFTVTPLVKSSAQAWAESDWQTLKSGSARFQAGSDRKGPMDIAVAVEPTPSAAAKEGEAPPAAGPRLAVFANSTFGANSVFDKVGNRDLFLNSVAWLAGNEQLISIRAKEDNEGIKAFNAGVLNLVLVVSVFLLPLALVGAGVFVWLRRSKL